MNNFKKEEIIPLVSLFINVSLALVLIDGTSILKYGLFGGAVVVFTLLIHKYFVNRGYLLQILVSILMLIMLAFLVK